MVYLCNYSLKENAIRYACEVPNDTDAEKWDAEARSQGQAMQAMADGGDWTHYYSTEAQYILPVTGGSQ